MPRRDETEPEGRRPMIGRKRICCSGVNTFENVEPVSVFTTEEPLEESAEEKTDAE